MQGGWLLLQGSTRALLHSAWCLLNSPLTSSSAPVHKPTIQSLSPGKDFSFLHYQLIDRSYQLSPSSFPFLSVTLYSPCNLASETLSYCSFNILVHSTYFFCSDLMWYVYRRWDWIWSWKPISLWLPWHHPEVSLLLSTFSPPPSSHPFFTYHVSPASSPGPLYLHDLLKSSHFLLINLIIPRCVFSTQTVYPIIS